MGLIRKFKLIRIPVMVCAVLLTIFVLPFTCQCASAKQITISSASELAKIGHDSEYPMDGDYVLEKDIDLSDAGWEPIGGRGVTDRYKDYIGIRGDCNIDNPNVFSGTFDGNGHVISGMTINLDGGVNAGDRNCGQIGLFSVIAGNNPDDPAVVRNLIMTDVNINVDFSDGFAAVGSLAGEVNGYAGIDNVAIVNGNIIANPTSACDTVGIGGVIGEVRTASVIGNGNVTISNVYNGVDVAASGTRHDYMYAAGIIGRIAKSKIGMVRNCINIGTILYDGFVAYPVTYPELGNNDMLANIKDCYYMENSAEVVKNEARCWSEADLTRGALPYNFDSAVWTAKKGCYPVPSMCLESAACADIVLFAGLKLIYSGDENASYVRSAVTLLGMLGDMAISWSSDSADVLRIEGDKAIPATDKIGTDVEVILTATTQNGRSKRFKLTIIPDEYIKAHFNTDYASIGKELKVVIDKLPGNDFTYQWSAGGVDKDNSTDTYVPVEADIESFITVVVTDNNSKMKWELTTYLSELPVIYINTDDGNPVTSNYVAKDAYIRVQGNSEFSAAATFYEGKTTIKGRGNSTWNEAVSMGVKKPYKLKLATKANLLGLGKVGNGKNKHWVLLANMIDHTNMRNEITYDFSRDMGLDCAMSSTGVVLILNGEYEGLYQLCEHVRIGNSRVNVYDWEELAEDVAQAICRANVLINRDELEESMVKDLSFITTGVVEFGGQSYNVKDYYKKSIPKITGGYLLGMDFRSPYDNNKYPSSFTSNNTIPMYIDTPENAKSCKEMMEYISGYINSFENAIKSTDYLCDYEGREQHYSELFDLESLVDYWFVCEITNNWDSMKNSTYMYKDIDSKIYMGPAWDYDWGYGNICMYSSGVLCNYKQWQTELSGIDPSEGGFAEQSYQKYQWNRYLVKDPYFVLKLYEKYKKTRATVFEGLIKEDGVISTLAKKYASASKANDDKWGFSYGDYKGYAFVDGKKVYTTSQYYDDAVESLATFIKKRIGWFDKQFVDFDTLFGSLGNKKSVTASVSVDTEEPEKVTANVSVNDKDASYVEIIVNGRRVETQSGDYLYDIKDGKAGIVIPKYYLNREDGADIVQAVWYNSAYKMTDNNITYAVFEYNENDIPEPLPTKTPRPSGEPAPTRYPFADGGTKPTKNPAAAPSITPSVTPASSPSSEAEQTPCVPAPVITPAPAGTQPGSPAGDQSMVILKETNAAKRLKVSFSVKGKKTVKCNKRTKLTVRVKGASGKIKWALGSGAKGYIRLNKRTGKKVTVKAGKKTGTFAVYVLCGSYKKTIKIKVRK